MQCPHEWKFERIFDTAVAAALSVRSRGCLAERRQLFSVEARESHSQDQGTTCTFEGIRLILLLLGVQKGDCGAASIISQLKRTYFKMEMMMMMMMMMITVEGRSMLSQYSCFSSRVFVSSQRLQHQHDA